MPGDLERFAATAGDYERYRPSYPAALADWIVEATGIAPPARVADLGAGTGISARLLAGRGFDVVGIEPGAGMIARARAAGGGVRYVRATAGATGLATGSVDLVAGGQSFHWFDLPAIRPELERIRRPGGWVVAFWNLRDRSPLLDEYEALLVASSRRYRTMNRAQGAIESIGALWPSAREGTFRHAQVFDLEGFLGRVRSSSYVVHDLDDPAAFLAALRDLFDRHATGGHVEFPYRTVAYAWV